MSLLISDKAFLELIEFFTLEHDGPAFSQGRGVYLESQTAFQLLEALESHLLWRGSSHLLLDVVGARSNCSFLQGFSPGHFLDFMGNLINRSSCKMIGSRDDIRSHRIPEISVGESFSCNARQMHGTFGRMSQSYGSGGFCEHLDSQGSQRNHPDHSESLTYVFLILCHRFMPISQELSIFLLPFIRQTVDSGSGYDPVMQSPDEWDRPHSQVYEVLHKLSSPSFIRD